MTTSEKPPKFTKKHKGINDDTDCSDNLDNPLVQQILEMWNRVETENIKYRENTFSFLKLIVWIEFAFVLILIILNIWINISPIIISSIITGVIIQTLGLVCVVVKYLFNNKDDKYLEYIAKIVLPYKQLKKSNKKLNNLKSKL